MAAGIAGENDVDQMLKEFDITNENLLLGDSDDIFATASETLTMEKTAELVAVAEGKAVDADCAMITLNAYREKGKWNNKGIAWYLYVGDINQEVINVIRPQADTISVLERTGAQIKEMKEKGFDLQGDGNPYEYLLFTKGEKELEDDKVYRLAVSTGELTEDMLKEATETEISPTVAIEQYVEELKTVSADVIKWED